MMRAVAAVWVGLTMLAAASPAFAKASDKEPQGIQLTGIQSFDTVFIRVGEIDKRLVRSETQLTNAKTNLNSALGLKKGAPFTTGLSELQKRAEGKLQLTLTNGAIPTLTVQDAVPSNVQSAVDAVNSMTTNFTNTIAELTGMRGEIDKLVKDTRKMPANLKDEFSAGGASIFEKLFQLPKTSKAVSHDVQLTAGLPGRVTSLTGRMTDIVGLVNTEFGNGRPAPAPVSGKKPAPRPPPKGKTKTPVPVHP